MSEYTQIAGTFAVQSLNTWGIGLVSTHRGGTKRYHHFDGLGSTVALTDTLGTVQDTYAYSAYGVLESSTGTSVNPYRYVGQFGYYDDGARGSKFGLLLLGVRYYSTTFGRFWSWDPIWPVVASALLIVRYRPRRVARCEKLAFWSYGMEIQCCQEQYLECVGSGVDLDNCLDREKDCYARARYWLGWWLYQCHPDPNFANRPPLEARPCSKRTGLRRLGALTAPRGSSK